MVQTVVHQTDLQLLLSETLPTDRPLCCSLPPNRGTAGRKSLVRGQSSTFQELFERRDVSLSPPLSPLPLSLVCRDASCHSAPGTFREHLAAVRVQSDQSPPPQPALCFLPVGDLRPRQFAALSRCHAGRDRAAEPAERADQGAAQPGQRAQVGVRRVARGRRRSEVVELQRDGASDAPESRREEAV